MAMMSNPGLLILTSTTTVYSLLTLGYVTYNQFRRGIPQNLLSLDDEELLIERYGERVNGTVNYFKMNTHVNRQEPRPTNVDSQLAKLNENCSEEHVPVGTEELLHRNKSNETNKPNEQLIEEKIQKFVFLNRIRLMEFFRDYDRHNCGNVSQNQFKSGLRLCQLPINSIETDLIVSKYLTLSYRVNYRNFCTSIDNVFTTNHLEQTPLASVSHPSREWLVQGFNELSQEEEVRCMQIITRFRNRIKERRLLMAPFFKDFDKILGNMGRVTRSHFSRLLSTMRLDVTDNDLHILFRKYGDHEQGKVNYMEFIRTIDPETYAAYSKDASTPSHIKETEKTPRSRTPDIGKLISRIQNHVRTKRVRVSEFFRDFDKLRCYSIRKEDFLRGFGTIGVTLSETEQECLCDKYADPKRSGYTRWKDFDSDIERVFGESHLESNPTFVHPLEVEHSPFVVANMYLSPREELILEQTLENIREHLRVRQISIKPFFRDFDRLCSGTGHVTKSQFRQCLTFMKVELKGEEFDILCKKWCKSTTGVEEDVPVTAADRGPFNFIKDVGRNICYFLFLEELEAGIRTESGALKKEALKADAAQPNVESSEAFEEEFEKLMMRIKIKVRICITVGKNRKNPSS